jgi:hypothetical protein
MPYNASRAVHQHKHSQTSSHQSTCLLAVCDFTFTILKPAKAARKAGRMLLHGTKAAAGQGRVRQNSSPEPGPLEPLLPAGARPWAGFGKQCLEREGRGRGLTQRKGATGIWKMVMCTVESWPGEAGHTVTHRCGPEPP